LLIDKLQQAGFFRHAASKYFYLSIIVFKIYGKNKECIGLYCQQHLG